MRWLSKPTEMKNVISDQISVPGIANGVFGRITDEAGNSVNGASVSLYSGDTLIGTATTQPDGTYIFKNVAAGRYAVHVSAAGMPLAVFDAYAADNADDYNSVNPVTFVAPAKILKTFSYPNPAREGEAHISFYTTKPSALKSAFSLYPEKLIKTISAPMALSGWREVSWSIDGVANGIYLYQIDAGGEIVRGKIAVTKWKQRR